jgi:hypothetical protein
LRLYGGGRRGGIPLAIGSGGSVLLFVIVGGGDR